MGGVGEGGGRDGGGRGAGCVGGGRGGSGGLAQPVTIELSPEIRKLRPISKSGDRSGPRPVLSNRRLLRFVSAPVPISVRTMIEKFARRRKRKVSDRSFCWRVSVSAPVGLPSSKLSRVRGQSCVHATGRPAASGLSRKPHPLHQIRLSVDEALSSCCVLHAGVVVQLP